MESIFVSTGVVALAEMGDKTQLLAFLLAARFKKPVPIILGILVATLFNHGLAGALGAWITMVVSPEILRWVLGLSFIGMAIWTLIPDKIEEEEAGVARRFGVFGATLITFFLDGRQDADRHGRSGSSLRCPAHGGCGNDAGDVDRRCAGRLCR